MIHSVPRVMMSFMDHGHGLEMSHKSSHFCVSTTLKKKKHLYSNEQSKLTQKITTERRKRKSASGACCLETMAREPLARDQCIFVCICILLIAHQSTCFYLPGVSPEDFLKVIITFLVFLQNHFCFMYFKPEQSFPHWISC